MKKFLFSFLLTLFVFLPTIKGECYVTLSYKDVPMAFGKVKMPMDLYIIEIDLSNTYAQVIKDLKTEAANKDSNIQELLLNFDLEKELKNIKLYQVGIDDGESYKTAFFITFSKNMEEYPAAINKYFTDDLTIEDKERFLQANKKVVDYWHSKGLLSYENLFAKDEITKVSLQKMSAKDYKQKIVFVDSEEPKIDFIKIDNKQAYSIQSRIIVELLGAISSKGYIFNVDDTVNGLFVLSLDSEREFWYDLVYNSLNLGIRP